ncbi:TPA: DNA replication complex GINS family protein [Candidatus Bathyarchaeota archaeon]|nr:DNA replication complex GINS family protein [Candidatus Bathyarchaeota archaeon]
MIEALILTQENVVSSIEDADYLFENKPSRVVAVRDSPKIELAGFMVGPFEKGNEYELKYWVARELEKAGIVHLREETLSASRLYPILHRERIQPVSSLSSLPEDFYPRLRRILESLRKASRSSPDKMREYEYVTHLSKDIISCRLKKIISLASTPGQKSQIIRNLTVEETALYEELSRIINEWRSGIL